MEFQAPFEHDLAESRTVGAVHTLAITGNCPRLSGVRD